MASSPTLSVALLPGAEELLRVHARELPQRDDFCGAFCGSLALFAAGLRALGGAALDQDEVALAAGTTVSTVPHTNMLPAGESGRRDYRLEPPLIGEHEESGTTAAGLVRALEELSEARLAAVPFDGPWSESTIAGLFDAALELEHPATLIANVATRHFWGARPSMAQLLGYLLRGELDGPRPDWDVGHFTCIGARIHGPAGTLSAILDTYPSLGVPANHALTPLGGLAEPNPFGSTGDLRLRPDADTHTRIDGEEPVPAFELVLCDIAGTDGAPWECCPRTFLRGALAELESELGATLRASFEHEFQLMGTLAPALPFSLEAQRVAEPFASRVMAALADVGVQPERFMPEFGEHQYEIPVMPAAGIAAA